MTRTGRTLSEYVAMGAAGMVALISFIRYLSPDSELYQETNPKDEFGEWYTQRKTNIILADIFDLHMAVHTQKGKTPKTYPRPREKRGWGHGAIKIKDFWKWWKGVG